jgi:small subunit ribosomal protein S17
MSNSQKSNRGQEKELIGIVVSNKMDKTIVVKVERHTRHPLYKKIVKKHNKFKAHDTDNSAKVGDKVRIIRTRPLSKGKRWRLAQVIK